MIYYAGERTPGFEPAMPDGTSLGWIFQDICPKEKLPGTIKGMFLFTVKPGCLDACHEHKDDAEIYYVLKGELELIDNDGQAYHCVPGDCMITTAGESHGVRNSGTEEALILGIMTDL